MGILRNPLGTRWIGFDAINTDGRIYGVHGTNQPNSVGKYISNGCVRLSNSDVERLYQQVPLGTKILIVSHQKMTLHYWQKNMERFNKKKIKKSEAKDFTPTNYNNKGNSRK